MKIQDLKKLVSQVGSVVLMDDSGVSLVVLSYEQYQSLLGIERPSADRPAPEIEPSVEHAETDDGFQQTGNVGTGTGNFGSGTTDREAVERLNREISLLKEEIKQRELQELAEETVVDPV